MNGEAEIERDPRALPRRGWAAKHRHAYNSLTILVGGIIGAAIGYIIWGLLN